MKANSDPLYKKFSKTDFSNAKPASAIPALVALQAERDGKSRITKRLDGATFATLRRAAATAPQAS